MRGCADHASIPRGRPRLIVAAGAQRSGSSWQARALFHLLRAAEKAENATGRLPAAPSHLAHSQVACGLLASCRLP